MRDLIAENMYCVVRGTKTFTLLPPSDIAFLDEQTYQEGSYTRAEGCVRLPARPHSHRIASHRIASHRIASHRIASTAFGADGCFSIQLEPSTVPWIRTEVATVGGGKHASESFNLASPLQCEVRYPSQLVALRANAPSLHRGICRAAPHRLRCTLAKFCTCPHYGTIA